MGTQVGTREKGRETKGDHQLSTTSGTTPQAPLLFFKSILACIFSLEFSQFGLRYILVRT